MKYTVPNVTARVKAGKRISTIEYGSMMALDYPTASGWITVKFQNSEQTMRIHKAEIINVW